MLGTVHEREIRESSVKEARNDLPSGSNAFSHQKPRRSPPPAARIAPRQTKRAGMQDLAPTSVRYRTGFHAWCSVPFSDWINYVALIRRDAIETEVSRLRRIHPIVLEPDLFQFRYTFASLVSGASHAGAGSVGSWTERGGSVSKPSTSTRRARDTRLLTVPSGMARRSAASSNVSPSRVTSSKAARCPSESDNTALLSSLEKIPSS